MGGRVEYFFIGMMMRIHIVVMLKKNLKIQNFSRNIYGEERIIHPKRWDYPQNILLKLLFALRSYRKGDV